MGTVITNKLKAFGISPEAIEYMGQPIKKMTTVWEYDPENILGITLTTTANNESVSLTTNATGKTQYTTFTTDWGDGTVETNSHTHIYATAGDYVVKVYKTNGTDITAIPASFLRSCPQIKSVTIPDTVTSCATASVSFLTGMETLTIGTGVTTITSGSTDNDGGAFRNNTALKELNFNAINCSNLGASGNGIFLLAGSAYPDTQLVINIGPQVTRIPNYFLYSTTTTTNNPKVKAINFLGNAVTTIGDYAFYRLYGTMEGNFTIPEGVTSIGQLAFEVMNCSGTLTIPDSVTTIGAYCFRNSKFTRVYVGKGVTTVNTSYAFNMLKVEYLYWNAVNCTGTFPSESNFTFNYLGSEAASCVLEIGKDCEKIPDRFFCCSNRPWITSMIFEAGSKLKSIGSYAFQRNDHLNCNLELPDSLETLGTYAFSDLRGMYGTLKLPSNPNFTSIPEYAFNAYTAPTAATNVAGFKGSLVIPDTVTAIGQYAFTKNSFSSITLGTELLNLATQTFTYNNLLTSLIVKSKSINNLTEGNNVFAYAGKETSGATVTIKNTVQKIPNYFLYSNTTTGANIKATSITFEAGSQCQSIGNYAFARLASLTNVDFSNASSLTSIGTNVFELDSAVTHLNIRGNNIGVGDYAFTKMTALRYINLYDGSWLPLTVDNYVFNTAGSGSDGITLNVQNGVTHIAANMFSPNGTSNAPKIVEIYIPASFNSFRAKCLYGVSALKDIYYLDGTIAGFNSIEKQTDWKSATNVTVHCSDGTIII